MSNTWQTSLSSEWPADFQAQASEGSFQLLISRAGDRMLQTTKLPDRPAATTPVEAIVGGKRHGAGFLTRVEKVEGLPLSRPALIQSRYAWSVSQGKLVLAPGCPVATPSSYRTAFGLVLSPGYEKRCLECHGKPNTLSAGMRGGVGCESCHGPGSNHLVALGRHESQLAIVNPKRLSNEESIGVCEGCHVGLTKFADPQPEDLLVANQATALKASECYLQSNHGLSCTTCHNPHDNAASSRTPSQAACLTCHSIAATSRHAAICPVNQTDRCLDCHMPAVDVGPFHLIDHQIRVHPEQRTPVPQSQPSAFASQLTPVSEFLRIIETGDRPSAESARTRLLGGEPFSKVALSVIAQSGAPGDGYRGRQTLAQLDPAVAKLAATLRKGQLSEVAGSGNHWFVIERMPRDFRWQAQQFELKAESLEAAGQFEEAIRQDQNALLTDPHSLAALKTLARLLAKVQARPRAAEVLRRANALFPDDAETAYLYGLAQMERGHHAEARTLFQRAITADGDYLPPYTVLGQLLLAMGDFAGARRTFEEGLIVDPLSGNLERSLAEAMTRQNDPRALDAQRLAAVLVGK